MIEFILIFQLMQTDETPVILPARYETYLECRAAALQLHRNKAYVSADDETVYQLTRNHTFFTCAPVPKQ